MGPITPMHTAIIFLLLAIEAYAHSMHTGGANAYVKQPLIHPRDATTTTTTREHVLRLILVVTGGEMEGGERTHYDNLKHINRWAEENQLDVLGISPDWVDVRIPTDVYADDVLDRVHVPYKLIIPDVQAEIARERSQYLGVLSSASSKRGGDGLLGFFDTYRTLDEMDQFIDSLVRNFPRLATKKVLGTSIEGRPINAIVIASPSNNRSVGFVYNGGQHAREWISPMTNAFIAYQLLSLYGRDAEVTRMVNTIEWTIIPIVNTDGYVYSWTNDRLWRKNRRNNGDGCYGVDLNRNWGYKWNTGGSSSNPCSSTYHGAFAFSEPEAKAVADYIESRHNVQCYIDFHSYSQMWMSQWGWSTRIYPNEYQTQNELSMLAVEAIRNVHNKTYTYGRSAVLTYIASGGADDWTLGALNVTWSYSVELGDTGWLWRRKAAMGSSFQPVRLCLQARRCLQLCA